MYETLAHNRNEYYNNITTVKILLLPRRQRLFYTSFIGHDCINYYRTEQTDNNIITQFVS